MFVGQFEWKIKFKKKLKCNFSVSNSCKNKSTQEMKTKTKTYRKINDVALNLRSLNVNLKEKTEKQFFSCKKKITKEI